jgi:methyl-accepting chemotaxis protein
LTEILGAVATLIGLSAGLLMTRDLKRQLGGEPAAAKLAAERIAAGDLCTAIAVAPEDRSSLLAALAHMREQLASLVSGVRGNADSVATASAEIAQGNSDLSSRTEQQASALQETAASMRQLAATVEKNTESAVTGAELAATASQTAAKGGQVVSQVIETMRGISASSDRIAHITSVIDGLAFQTNILALNAAVESARAGEQGRGFAVVAGEVRTLAQRSADAAKEIRTLIEDSVRRAREGSELVDAAGATMAEVVQSVGRVEQLMHDISVASREQNSGVRQIGDAVHLIDQTTQQNAALVEQGAAAAGSLKEQAQALVAGVASFKVAA